MRPALVRLRGFPGHSKPIRVLDGGTPGALAAMDRMGTVPALNYEGRRVQTNRAIFAFLEERRPDPSHAARQRASVEESFFKRTLLNLAIGDSS